MELAEITQLASGQQVEYQSQTYLSAVGREICADKKHEVQITEAVLVAAAGIKCNSHKLLDLLLAMDLDIKVRPILLQWGVKCVLIRSMGYSSQNQCSSQ